jgi:hypothetical protein
MGNLALVLGPLSPWKRERGQGDSKITQRCTTPSVPQHPHDPARNGPERLRGINRNRSIDYGTVMSVIAQIGAVGFKNITLAADAEIVRSAFSGCSESSLGLARPRLGRPQGVTKLIADRGTGS